MVVIDAVPVLYREGCGCLDNDRIDITSPRRCGKRRYADNTIVRSKFVIKWQKAKLIDMISLCSPG
jgi:hypothetical protein